jgi:hypothetical protein
MGCREAEREMHEAAAHELTVKLVKARSAARAYFRLQESEAKRHDYPPRCEFAHLIASGTIHVPAYVDVAELEIVAEWLRVLAPVNQSAMLFQFDTIHGGVPWQRMLDKYPEGRWNRFKFNRRIEDLLRDLGGRL